jgi:hypothetical protein
MALSLMSASLRAAYETRDACARPACPAAPRHGLTEMPVPSAHVQLRPTPKRLPAHARAGSTNWLVRQSVDATRAFAHCRFASAAGSITK